MILLLSWSGPLYSQNYDSFKNSWDKILIFDAYAGWKHFANELEIKKINNELIVVNKNGSIINKVKQTVLDDFFNSLKNDSRISSDPLRIFGKDSVWLINNADSLWHSYVKVKEPPEIDSFAINAIKDYSKIKSLVLSLRGSHWTDDYPSTSIFFIKGRDTLEAQSYGQYPFMMPWIVNGKTVYNAGIPIAISEVLPDSLRSNKSRLRGDRFNYALIDRIHNSLIRDYKDLVHAKIKYPKQFSVLEQHYKITNARLADMGSIEWGGFMSAPCLELTLNTKSMPENICFSVIFGRRIRLHSVKPLIRKEDRLMNRLSNNQVYQYTLKNLNALGEIHFVNTKSLSGQAKRNFMSDLKENGIKKITFRGKLRRAIFYELTESRGKSSSFSRWIFLKNGTNILWEIKGDFLMNLTDDFIRDQGYVCQTIPN